MESADLARVLAAAGLVIGTLCYYSVIRRRQRQRDAAEARVREDGRLRALAHFRRLERRDRV